MVANEPAFPLGESYITTDLAGNQNTYKKGALHNGLTKREYFAAIALNGLCSNLNEFLTSENAAAYANQSFMIADAMIKESKNGR